MTKDPRSQLTDHRPTMSWKGQVDCESGELTVNLPSGEQFNLQVESFASAHSLFNQLLRSHESAFVIGQAVLVSEVTSLESFRRKPYL